MPTLIVPTPPRRVKHTVDHFVKTRHILRARRRLLTDLTRSGSYHVHLPTFREGPHPYGYCSTCGRVMSHFKTPTPIQSQTIEVPVSA